MADRKISDLTALTAPAAGDYLPIVDISEVSAANKNKRITIEELLRGAPDGTAAAPSIGFESDPNTGIYSPGADALGLVTGGTDRLRITSAGLVGVGTSSPLLPLHVEATTDGPQTLAYLVNASTGGTNETAALAFGLKGTAGTGICRINAGKESDHSSSANTDTFLSFATTLNDTEGERFRITSAGNVGIGTTSPTQRLQITDGTLSNFYVAPGYNSGVGTLLATGGSEYLAFATNGLANERARIDSDGRLLVGTGSNSGGALLQVNDNRIRVATAKTPASAADTGTAGEICWDTSYIYVCTATNTWKRAALSTW